MSVHSQILIYLGFFCVHPFPCWALNTGKIAKGDLFALMAPTVHWETGERLWEETTEYSHKYKLSSKPREKRNNSLRIARRNKVEKGRE